MTDLDEDQTQYVEGNVKVDQTVKRREVKLTKKGLLLNLDTLQKQRKSRFEKAAPLKSVLTDLMVRADFEKEVKSTFDKFKIQCQEAKEAHESLLVLLPNEEREKHETWFKAKSLWVEEFSTVVTKWLEQQQEENRCADSEINPNDSVSNIETRVHSRTSSQHSSSSTTKSKSSVQRVRIQVEAERAALVAHAKSLKDKHELEEQVEKLRK